MFTTPLRAANKVIISSNHVRSLNRNSVLSILSGDVIVIFHIPCSKLTMMH